MKEVYTWKALLVPVNSKKEILIQDRRNFKKPDWGFFGWWIESWEIPIQAVIRESKEELDIDILEQELTFLGEVWMQWNSDNIPRYFFLYQTDQEEFTVLEWAWAHWMNFKDARDILDKRERFDELIEKIDSLKSWTKITNDLK